MKYLAPLMLLLLPSCLATSADLERIKIAFDSTMIQAQRANEEAQRDLVILRGNLEQARMELAEADEDSKEQLQERIDELEQREEELAVQVANAWDALKDASEEFGDSIEGVAADVKERYEQIVSGVGTLSGTGPVGWVELLGGALVTALGVNASRNRSRERGQHLPPEMVLAAEKMKADIQTSSPS